MTGKAAAEPGAAPPPPPHLHPVLAAVPILGAYGVVYLALALGTAPGGPRAALQRGLGRLR